MHSNALLVLGSALIAYGPFLALFSLLVYQKAQLVIVVTTAAFFYLLATLAASIAWRILQAIGWQGDGLAAILPGVFFQFILRCCFVALYHKVERVIQWSLEKQHEEELEAYNNNNNYNYNMNNNNVIQNGETQQQQHQNSSQQQPPSDVSLRAGRNSRHGVYGDHANHYHNSNLSDDEQQQQQQQQQQQRADTEKLSWTEAAKLRLQLNDASCGVAAGVGFGGMHAVLLYGTLLASETGLDQGVLYQAFCPMMPSLAVSAIYAFCFSILDIFWMLLTFFGMRRRLMYHRGERAPDTITGVGSYLGNSRNGGNVALLLCLATHSMASIFTLTNLFSYGCTLSLPLVGAVVLLTAYLFWAGVGRIYMPPMMMNGTSLTPGTPRGQGAATAAASSSSSSPYVSMSSSRRRLTEAAAAGTTAAEAASLSTHSRASQQGNTHGSRSSSRRRGGG